MYRKIVVQFVWFIYYMVGLYRQFPGAIFSLLLEVILCPLLSVECILWLFYISDLKLCISSGKTVFQPFSQPWKACD